MKGDDYMCVFKCIFNENNNHRLLCEYWEILTRACECHAKANECQYFSIFVQ